MKDILPKYSTLSSASFFILISVITLLLMVYGQSIFIPIIIAIAIWFLINHITDTIHRFKIAGYQMPRKLAMSLGLILIIILTIRIARLLYGTSLELVEQAPTYAENLDALLQSIPPSVWELISVSNEEEVASNLGRLLSLATSYLSAYATSLATNVTYLMGQSVLILVYVIFLLLEQYTFVAKLKNMFPNAAQRSEVEVIILSIKQQVQKYFAVKTYVSLLTGIVSFIVMWLYGVDFAVVWAILIFLLNFIPYIGSIIGVAFPVLMVLLQFGDWPPVIGILLLLILIQTAISYFVEPVLMGNSLDISPFIMLVSLAVFGAIWGITGMFLSVPILIILIVILSHFDVTRPIAVLLSGDGIVYGVIEQEE